MKFVLDAARSLGYLVAPPALAILLTLIFCTSYIIYLVFACCFKLLMSCIKLCIGTNEEGDIKKPQGIRYIKYTVFSCVIILMVLGVFSTAYMSFHTYYTVKGLDRVKCGLTAVMDDMSVGFRTENIKFAGARGIAFLLDSIENSVFAITPEERTTYIMPLLERNFSALSTRLDDSFTNYYNANHERQVLSCKPGDSIKVMIPEGQTLTKYIDESIKSEIQPIQLIAEHLHAFAAFSSVVTLSDPLRNATKAGINLFEGALTSISDSINKGGKFISENKFVANLKFRLIIALIIIICFMLGILACYSSFMYWMVYKEQGMYLVWLGRCVSCTECFLGCIISVGAILLLLTATILINGCFLFNLALKDSTLMRKLTTDVPIIEPFMETCMYSNSSGSFIDLLNQEGVENKFKAIIANITGIDKLHTIKQKYSSNKEFVSIKSYSSVLVKKSKFEGDAYTGPDGFATNIVGLQKAVADAAPNSKDVFTSTASKCPSDFIRGSKDDAVDKGFGTPYCITIPEWRDSISGRYPKTNADVPYSNLFRCHSDYKEAMSSMNFDLSSIESAAHNINQAFIDSQKEIDFLLKKLSNSTSFLDEYNGGIDRLLDCRVLRQELDIVRFSTCSSSSITLHYGKLAVAAGILGPLLSLLGCCMWCQLGIASDDISINQEIEKQEKRASEGMDDYLVPAEDSEYGL